MRGQEKAPRGCGASSAGLVNIRWDVWSSPVTQTSWPYQRPVYSEAILALSRAPPERADRAKLSGHTRPALPPATLGGNRQRHRPSYTVSPAGKRLKRSRPAPGAAQSSRAASTRSNRRLSCGKFRNNEVSELRQITKIRPSDASGGKPFQRRCNLAMVGADLEVIWGMSV